MSSNDSPLVARRGFLARLSASAAGLTLYAGARPRLGSALAPLALAEEDPDAWIDRLRGTDRLLFHAHQRLMPAIANARGILNTGREAYNVPEADNAIAIATHGPAISGLFRDEIWERFALGDVYKITDAKTGAPAVRNPFLVPQDGAPSDATVPALMERGVLFIVCNVAVQNLSRRLLGEAAPDADSIHHALLAGLVPGAIVVPNVHIAMSHAQKKGVSYIFVD